MSPLKVLPVLAALWLLAPEATQAQAATETMALNPEFKIDKVVPTLVDAPTSPDKRLARPKKWLEVEVIFDWQPRTKIPLYTDEATFNYYILLSNASFTEDRKPTMLTGSVTHVNVAQGRDLHSVMYVSPRTLEKYFGGNSPTGVPAAIFDIGVSLTVGGQVVAIGSLKGSGNWWTNAQYTPTAGGVLTKAESPFATVAWDYYEPMKATK